MDAFFASIEERDNPRLAGRPIVVGSDPEGGKGRGVVSTANYAARAYGIRSALPISTAWRLSEAARKKGLLAAAFLEVNMEKYSEVSHRIMEIVRNHVPPGPDGVVLIQQASVDEAYFDLSFSGSYEAAEKIVRAMKDDIHLRERLTASVGVGPNKLIAKIASDRQKPDGLTIVQEKDAETFLAPLGLRVIPGIGPKSEEQFKKLGVYTVGDARHLSAAELTGMMGKWGTELYEKLRGRSDSPIVMDSVQKSISSATTFAHDVAVKGALKDRKLLESTLADLALDVYRAFQRERSEGAPFTSFRTVGITVRFADFSTKTRAVTLPDPVMANDDALQKIQFQALRLFMPFLDGRENPYHKAIRLLAVKIEKFI